MLIGMGADPNALNCGLHPYAMPLHNAVSSGFFEAVRILVEAGARVDARDAAHQAKPLTWAEYFLREEKNKKQ
jgi:hypothetical protein